MKNSRIAAASIAAAAAFGLAACGSASNDSSGNSASSNSSSSSAAGASAGSSASSGSSAGGSATCFSGSLKSSGSTAQQNAINQAIAAYTQQCKGAKTSYTGSGSGQGITDFIGKQTDWAGSDSALDPAKGEPDKAKASCGSQAIDLPMVVGPIAVIYNLKGVGKLILTPQLTAKIFSGKITEWNNAEIAKANPGVKLPSQKISVFFRSEASGTSDNFSNFLNQTDKTDWPDQHSKQWTGKVGQGKKGSAGVGQAVSSTPGAIGYDEWSYAITNKLNMAEMDSGSGPVALTAESAGQAIAAAKVVGTGKDVSLAINYNTKAKGAYPIVLATYEIACLKYSNPTTAKNVKAFLTYLASDGFQGTLTQVGSAPLPKSIQQKVQESIAAIS
ncbi:phosphate ABC transporter substrate-binding protein PstS [Flexivirga caeni]|uniref:Phosphate-binding protein n=1 Tax=Flexivirga caeni TaxID=2294115 RepID=A0A3M9ME09_9MICO|nr:phosphate ABC transporter substrate-binding protein PstS [Flexivirga caeni]RNI23789.1 phosphate ABC transporter substrate-binding protein PstS [Flexivirga caeni]